jgi:hypothetical protein
MGIFWAGLSLLATGMASDSPPAIAVAPTAEDTACLKPGLPLADDPPPQLLRHARAQLDAYLACVDREVARLRAISPRDSAASQQSDRLRAEADRIAERWARYADRIRNRDRR